jgi:Putative beta-barrel porin 2
MRLAVVGLLSSVCLLCSTPAHAQAPAPSPAPSPSPEGPLTLTFGPFSIQPAFRLRNMGRDNNVFNEDTDPKSDFTVTISPAAVITFKARRLKVGFTQATDYVYFQKYETERGTNYSSSARVDVDLGLLQPYAVASGTNSRDRFNNEVDTRARHRDRAYGAGVALKLFTRTTANVGVRQMTYGFDQGVDFRGENLASSFDSRIELVEAGVGYALTPLTSLALNLTYERQRFVTATERDANTIRVMPTMTFSPLGLLNGTVAVGYRQFTPLDPLTPAFAGVVAEGGVGFTVFENHRFEARVHRDLDFSYDRATPYYVTTSESLGWTYVLAVPFDVKLNALRDRMHYMGPTGQPAVGDDVYTTYGAGVGYRLRPQFRLGVQADWLTRDSQRDSSRGYRNRKIYGTLTWGILL